MMLNIFFMNNYYLLEKSDKNNDICVVLGNMLVIFIIKMKNNVFFNRDL